jgi:hypothetical protein
VVLGRWLNIPDVTPIAEELTAGEGVGDGLTLADGATGGVDEPGALLHLADELDVEEALGSFVEGAVLHQRILKLDLR